MVEQAKPQRSRVGAFFAHPATLILIGGAITALLSGLLVPSITRGWQNHDRELDRRAATYHEELGVKSRLVTQIGHATSDFLGASLLQAYKTKTATAGLTNYDNAYVQWSKASAQVASQLAAYFPRANVGLKWAYFSQNMRNTYNLLRNHPGDERARWLKKVANYLRVDLRTINGVLDRPLHGNERNQTYEGELRFLLHATQEKEAFIVCHVVSAPSSLDQSPKQPQPPVSC